MDSTPLNWGPNRSHWGNPGNPQVPKSCLSHSAYKSTWAWTKDPSPSQFLKSEYPLSFLLPIKLTGFPEALWRETITCVSGGGAPIGGSIGGKMPGGMGGIAGGL